MAAHGNQVVLSHTNLLLSSTGLEPGMCTFYGFTFMMQDSKVGNFPQSCVQYSMMSSQHFPLPLVGDYRFASSMCCLFENHNIFLVFENHPVFWAVTLQQALQSG